MTPKLAPAEMILPNNVRILIADIVFIHPMGPYVRIYTQSCEHITTRKWVDMQHEVPDLVQISRRYYIRPSMITTAYWSDHKDGRIRMITGHTLTVPRGFFATLQALVEQWSIPRKQGIVTTGQYYRARHLIRKYQQQIQVALEPKKSRRGGKSTPVQQPPISAP